MDWEVTGAHKDTGKDAVVIVQGETAEDAARAAAALGLFVSRTKPREQTSHASRPAQIESKERVLGPAWVGGASVALAVGAFLGFMISEDANSVAGMFVSLGLVVIAFVLGVWGLVWGIWKRSILALVPLVGICLAAIPIVIVVVGAAEQANRAIEQSRHQR